MKLKRIKNVYTYARSQSKNVQAQVLKLCMFNYASCMHVQRYFANISATEAQIFMKF